MSDILITNDPGQIGGTATTTNATYFDANYASRASHIDNAVQAVQSVPDSVNDFWVQFTQYRFYRAYLAGSADAHQFFFDDGTTWASLPIVSGIQKFRTYDAPGGAATTLDVGLTANAVIVIDIHVVRDNGDGTATFELYVDGTLEASHTGTIGAGTVSNRFALGSAGTWGNDGDQGGYISNLRISTVSTVDTRFRSLPVSVVGTYDAFVGGGFAALTDTDALTFAHSDTPGQRVSGTVDHTAIPAGVGSISSVSLTTKVRPQGPGAIPDTLAHFARISATDYDQAAVTPGAASGQMVTDMTVNPATGVAWADADFNGAEFGLVSSNAA